MFELSENEIRKRLRDYENLKKCHAEMRVRQEKYRAEIKELRAQVAIIPDLLRTIESLRLQVEELNEIIFGKKKKKDGDGESTTENQQQNGHKNRKKRNAESYNRKQPEASEVTETKKHAFENGNCPNCGTKLSKVQVVTFWIEDIPVPTKESPLKRVTEHQVEVGWCKKCRQKKRAFPLPNGKVFLGPNVKLYICYLSILLRLSHPQIMQLLKDGYGYEVSVGEIENVMEQLGRKLRPEFERIRKRLQESKGVHMDETSWRKLYLWVMTGTTNDDTIYLAGRNRGNGNIDDLLGEQFEGVRVSDGYKAYKNKAGIWQQCWAHPHRKLRDLANTKTLSEEKHEHCKSAYESFSKIYEQVRLILQEPFEKEKMTQQKRDIQLQLRSWTTLNCLDPKKLENIKNQLKTEEPAFLACFDAEGIPCDNNKAERMLRHFVLKRKISFGTKTERTSTTFETLASVFMTYWKKSQKTKENLFDQLAHLCGFCWGQ